VVDLILEVHDLIPGLAGERAYIDLGV